MNKQDFIKRLSEQQPDKLTKNDYSALPEAFLAHDKIEIQCRLHGIFAQKAYSHLIGNDCPHCGLVKKANGRAGDTETFVRRSKERFGDQFDYGRTQYIRQDQPVIIDCPEHGSVEVVPKQHLKSTHGCPHCSEELPRRQELEQYLERANVIHKGRYDYSRIDYRNGMSKVELGCPDHGTFWQSLDVHVRSESGCPQCARQADRLSLEEFLKRSASLHQDQYDYGLVKFEKVSDVVEIRCPKHGVWSQRVASHLAGNGCPECFRDDSKLTTAQFIENARIVHGDAYDYSKVDYDGNKVPVEIVCRKHGSFWMRPNTHVSGRNGCLRCRESTGERMVAKELEMLTIPYKREFIVKPYRYRFDFFLPDANVFIEFHGAQHYRPVPYFGGQKAFDSLVERDRAKEDIVRATKAKMIVLNYLNQNELNVGPELRRRLKRLYPYWFRHHGKIRVFRNPLAVYREFNVPMDTPLEDLEETAVKLTEALEVVF